MSIGKDRHSRRRMATRQKISDIATALFAEHGFDRVTIDIIAEAADVGRMTVFNHFARKEDLFFDREPEIRTLLRETLAQSAPKHPFEALRLCAHRLIAEDAPFLRFTPQSQSFIATLSQSETLRSRARALRDEITTDVAHGTASALCLHSGTPRLHLAATLLVAGWSRAYSEAQSCFAADGTSDKAQNLFLSLIDITTKAAFMVLEAD
ncbi:MULTISPECIES: TetR/AcrR family transcriptional regulator [Asaia]|uniref:TetR/AcrR family transcriptional regulator n=1 Tax=Asaia TaxID=91914 RepID=UPI002FC32354